MKPLYLIAEIHPDPTQLSTAIAAYEQLIQSTRQEPGCLLYDLVVENENEGWIMLEKWESREAWENHMNSEHVRHLNEVAPSFSAEPTKLRFLETAAADRV